MEKVKTFFVNLYNKFINLSFVQWTIDYCKENVTMALIVGGAILAILILLIVIGSIRRKKKKAIRKIRKEMKVSKKEAKKIYAARKYGVTQEDWEAAAAEEAEEKAKATQAKVVVTTEIEQPAAEAPKAKETVEEKPVENVLPVEEKKVETPVEEVAATESTTVEVVEIKPETAELVEEPVKEEAFPVEEKTPVFPVKAETPVEEKPVKEVAPVVETPVKKEVEPVEAKEAPVKPKEAKPVEEKKRTRAQDAEEVLAAMENADEDDKILDNADEDETDRQAKYKGKWVICRVLTDEEGSEEMYFFELHASNGEKLLSSEEYTTYQGALRGIETHKANILKGNLKLTLSKKGDFIFKLLSGKNMLLCMGENYPSRARCESAIESTKRFAATAVVDENVQDIVIKVPKEEDSPLPALAENVVGKWIISSTQNPEGETVYFFELFANNGEKLLSSEEYTTYIGAVNGIQTHKKNIQQNNFRISLTKRGDYIYKLLNGNGQLLCLGEHYKTKRLCQRAVESVQRFALNSPVLTSDKK